MPESMLLGGGQIAPEDEEVPRQKSWYESLASGAFDFLDLLNRPTYALGGAITRLQKGEGAGEALSGAWKGISGQERRTWDDILANLGIEGGIPRSVAALGLDIVTDPLTYALPFGLTKAGKMGKILGKATKLTAPGIAKKARRLQRLGVLMKTGGKGGLATKEAARRLAGKGLAQELALKLATGEYVAPLGKTLAEQAKLGQRVALAAHIPLVGRVPIIKGKSMLEGMSKGMAWAGKTKPVQVLKGIFTRTTGNKLLDEAMYKAGGIADVESYYRMKFDDHGVALKQALDHVYKEVKDIPDGAQRINDAILTLIEPVGKAERARLTASQLAAKITKAGQLSDDLTHLKPMIEEAADRLKEGHKLIAGAEKAYGLPLETREFYIRHQFTPEARKVIDSSPEVLDRILRDKAFHGSLESLQMTAVGNIPEVNTLAKAGKWGEAMQSVPKMLEDNPMELFAVRARMAQNAIAGGAMIQAAEKLSAGGKFIAPSKKAYTAMRKAHPGAELLVVDKKRGLMRYREILGEFMERPVQKGLPKVAFDEQVAKLAERMAGEQLPGLGVTTDALGQMREKGYKLLFVDPDLAEAIVKHRDVVYSPDAMESAAKSALGAYDAAHSFLRRSTLGYFPGWVFRNSIGNFSAQHYMGMRPWDMIKSATRAGRIQRSIAKGTDDVVEFMGDLRRSSYVMDQAKRFGVVEKGMFGMELPGIAGKKVRRMNPVLRGMFSMNRAVENNARLGAWLWALDEGYSPADAAETVKKYLFDYGALSKTEKGVFKRAAFFYTWFRKNIPMQVETLLTKPGKIVPLAAAQAEMLKRAGIEKDDLPEWAAGLVPMPYGKKGSTILGAELSSWIPFGDLQRIAQDPGKDLIGQGSPLWKLPLELLMNRSIFMDREIQRYPGETEELGVGLRAPAKVAYAAQQWRPVGTLGRVLATQERRRIGIAGEALRYITGARGYAWDVEKVKAGRQAKNWKQVGFLKRMHRYYRNLGGEGEAKKKEIEDALIALGEEIPKA